MIGSKHERPMKVCISCGKEKPIVKHLNGDPNAPVCAACYMKSRRASASSDQVKAIKLAATIIGVMEKLLGLDLDSGQEQEILAMQARFKILACAWLGEKAPDPVNGDSSAAKRSADSSAKDDGHSCSPGWSELTQAERDERILAGQRAACARRRAQRDAEQ